MAKITAKENFLKLAAGGHPEYVPYYTFSGNELVPEICVKSASPGLFVTNPPNPDGSTTSVWGVTTYPNQDTADSAMPAPNVFIMDDIRKWGDAIRKPVYKDGLNFEEMYKADMERIGIDRNMTALTSSGGFGPWMSLVGFMGFEGAMVAMATEPEYVKELLDWMASLYEPYHTQILDTYKPDLWKLSDDTCTERAPFFSVDMYRDLFKPIYTRLGKQAANRGIPIVFHICGFFEPFVPEMIDFGVQYLESVQEVNDINGLKKQYPNKMSYLGCHDWGKHVPKNYPNYDEEEVRQDIRNTIDIFAPGGGFGTLIWPVSYVGDPNLDPLKRIVWDEAYNYGKKVYGYKD